MDKEHPTRWTLYADPSSCVFLADFLKNSGFLEKIKLEPATDTNGVIRAEAVNIPALIFKTPIRLGELLDTLNKTKPSNLKSRNIIDHKAFTLDKTLGTLNLKKFPKSQEIRLTEKEVAVIDYLYSYSHRTVSRKELLTAVWDYAESVETHTLETHIYRLRQKIEVDPSAPRILCTDENGYTLKG